MDLKAEFEKDKLSLKKEMCSVVRVEQKEDGVVQETELLSNFDYSKALLVAKSAAKERPEAVVYVIRGDSYIDSRFSGNYRYETTQRGESFWAPMKETPNDR